MNLFKALIISWLTGVSLYYLKDANIDYQANRLIMSLSFFIMAVFCYYYFLKELTLKNRNNIYIIGALCFCMIISSWFNLLFISPDIYYLLIEAKRGDGLSWKNIYKSVELLALLMVGKDGFIHICNWLVCRCRRFNVIIANNSTYKIGR